MRSLRKPAAVIEHQLTTLASGLRVVTEQLPGVRSTAIGFFIGTGSATETPEQAGLSHLLEHMLFRGTKNYESEEVDQIFDGMGAEINAGTTKEATSVYARVLDQYLEKAFDVMGELVWQPRFSSLDAEKEIVLDEIAMYADDPQNRANNLFDAAVFGSHPLGLPIIGTADVISATTHERLAAFHAERYLPTNIVIAAAGSVDHDELVALASKAQPRVANLSLFQAPKSEMDFQRRVGFFQKDAEQYHLYVGGAGLANDDERRYALRVLEGIFGGTSSSRLNQEIRERRGLAYSVGSYSQFYAHTGQVGVYLGTRAENLKEALAVVASELSRCVADPATEVELARSRENLKGRIGLALESTGARMSRLGGSILGGLPILSVDEMMENIDAVTMADVRELAAELFVPERLCIGGAGPDEAAFLAAIGPLGGPGNS